MIVKTYTVVPSFFFEMSSNFESSRDRLFYLLLFFSKREISIVHCLWLDRLIILYGADHWELEGYAYRGCLQNDSEIPLKTTMLLLQVSVFIQNFPPFLGNIDNSRKGKWAGSAVLTIIWTVHSNLHWAPPQAPVS